MQPLGQIVAKGGFYGQVALATASLLEEIKA